MYVVAIHKGLFFRAQSTNEDEIEITKSTMLKDNSDLMFEIMTEEELEKMLKKQ